MNAWTDPQNWLVPPWLFWSAFASGAAWLLWHFRPTHFEE